MACLLAAGACAALPLRAQNDAEAPAGAPVFQGLRVEPASAGGPETPARDAGGFGWSLAPVRWGGSVSSELRVVGVEDQPRRVQRIDSAEARGATYIWQPWFVQVSGGLGVFASTVLSGETSAASGLLGASSDTTALTGNGALSVFPASRFPFQARVERSDSRTSGEVSSADFTTTRVGLRQDYRPNGSSTNYSFTADRSVLDSESLGRDTLEVWEARMTGQSGAQNYDLTGSRSSNSRSQDGESRLERLTARHSYREGAGLSVETLASANSNEFREASLFGPIERRSRFVQFSSFANWRPERESPWYLTGGLRVFRSETGEAGASAQARTVSGNLGVTYQLNRKTTLSGIAAVSEVLTEQSRDVISTQGASVTYTPDLIPLGRFQYGRSLSANLSNQSGAPEGDRRAVTGQFTHTLTRSIALASRATVTTNVAQSLQGTDDSVNGSSSTLLHSAGLSWSGQTGERSSAYASLSAADSRRTGFDENRFQLVNAQANGQFQFSRHAFATANLTAQATRVETPQVPAEGFDTNTSGNLSYQHARAFGVAGLRYSAVYSVSESQLASRRLGDLNAPLEQASQSLEQRLDYDIGRLETRLLARIAEIQGKLNGLVFLRVSRRFGAY